MNDSNALKTSHHEFGGVSTDLKLSMVEGYLRAFMTALRGKYSQLWYIDAFAGTGERTVKHAASPAGLLHDATEERLERLRGSAKIAIDIQPVFDRLIFIDAKKRHYDALLQLKAENPARNIQVVRADANQAIRSEIARHSWSGIRAVMFLDPYGMHVDWETLKFIQETKAIDVWYLVSLSGLFRQATLDKRALNEQKRRALNRMLGTNDWETEWYAPSPLGSLFDDEEQEARTADIKAMEKFVQKRLGEIFPKVLPPRTLRNERNLPMFSLFFAASNPDHKAIGLATKIASHILKAGN